MGKGAPDIFRYTDYRAYLHDLFAYKKAHCSAFSYRYFSSKAGYRSPTVLKEVINGTRNIPWSRINDFVRPFGLTKKAAEYFRCMVRYADAVDEFEKSKYYRNMIVLRRSPKSRSITPRDGEFYHHWYNSAIRELAGIKGFSENPAWIAERLNPAITEREARMSVGLLLKLGFLRRTKSGRLVQDTPKLDVDPDLLVHAVRDFTRRMIELGWESIERYAPAEREVSGVTMAMSRKTYRAVKEMVRKAQDEILDYVCNDDTPSETVCRLNVELFPLIRDTGGDDDDGPK